MPQWRAGEIGLTSSLSKVDGFLLLATLTALLTSQAQRACPALN